MKKRNKLWNGIAVLMLAMMFCLPVAATSMDNTKVAAGTATLEDESINVCQVYLVKGEDADAEPIPRAMIYDGITLLEEGSDKDYTLSLEKEDEDGWIMYYVTITGAGDYAAEDVSLEYEFYEEEVGEILEVDDWTILYVESEEEAYILSYNGDDAAVEIPEYLGDDEEYEVYDIYPGTFYNKTKLESVDLLEYYPLKGAMFINCPNLTSVRTDYDTDGGEYVESAPGPLVIGGLNGTLSIAAPSDYLWIIEDEEGNETELTLQDYCKEYGYKTETVEEVLIVGDWTYQISTANHEAIVVSYTGDEADVKVPEVVEDGDDEYDVYEIQTNAFDGLETLETIDLQQASLISYLCKDCPNLKTITCRTDDIELDGPIVEGEAPAKGELTIRAYPDLEWILIDEETDEEILYTLEQYCEDYGYVYEELEDEYLTFDVVTADETAVAVAGDTVQMDVYANSALDSDFLSVMFPDATVKDWTVLGEAADYAKISSTGQLTIGTTLSEEAELLVQCTVVRPATSASGDATTVETKVSGSLTVYPKLTGNKTVLLPQDASQTLTCKMNVFSEDEWEVMPEALPEDVTVTYEVADETIVSVSEGVVTATQEAEVGATTTVTATYTIDEKEYVFTYNIKVVEPVDISEIGDETIYVYGWDGCGFDIMLNVFEGVYSDLAGQIEYVELYPEDEVEDDDENPWDFYVAMIEDAMAGDTPPDIVLWPDDYVLTKVNSDEYVSLDTIGFDTTLYDNAFPYVKANGTVNGKLYAVTTSVNPGCFVYNKAMAIEVFGTDDATQIQEKVKDWATFIASAKTLREKEYYMLSNLDLEYTVFGGKTKPWVTDGVLALEDNATTYLSLLRQLYLSDVVDPDDYNWDMYGDIEYKEDCFGFFADAEYITQNAQFKSHKNEYGICAGPQYFSNDYAPYMAVTTVRNNDKLVELLLETLVSNSNVMESCMSNGLGIMNHEAQLTEYATSNPEYNVWLEVAKNVPVVAKSAYDYMLEDTMVWYYSIYYWVDELSKEAVEAVDLGDLLDEIKADFEDMYSSLEVTVPTEVEWEDFTQSEEGSGDDGDNPGAGGEDPGADGENSGTGGEDSGTGGDISSPTPSPETNDNTISTNPGDTGNTTFGKNSEFTKGNNRYKVLSIKGKKGTVAWLGVKSKKANTIKIPNTVKNNAVTFKVVTIANKACKNNKKLKKITIPKNVTTIGKQAFSGCKNLKTIKINSKKLSKVGKKALKGINKKAVIDVPNKNVKAYKKLFKKKGQAKTVKIK